VAQGGIGFPADGEATRRGIGGLVVIAVIDMPARLVEVQGAAQGVPFEGAARGRVADEPTGQFGDGEFIAQGGADQLAGIGCLVEAPVAGLQAGSRRVALDVGEALAEGGGNQDTVGIGPMLPAQSAAGAFRVAVGGLDAQGETGFQGEMAQAIPGWLVWAAGGQPGATAQAGGDQAEGEKAPPQEGGCRELQGWYFLRVALRVSLPGSWRAASCQVLRASSWRPRVHRTSPRWAAISGSALRA